VLITSLYGRVVSILAWVARKPFLMHAFTFRSYLLLPYAVSVRSDACSGGLLRGRKAV
jgi:hypothetical protein